MSISRCHPSSAGRHRVSDNGFLEGGTDRLSLLQAATPSYYPETLALQPVKRRVSDIFYFTSSMEFYLEELPGESMTPRDQES